MGFYRSEYDYLAEDPFPGLVNYEEVPLSVEKRGEEYGASFIPVTWGGVNENGDQ